jgi:hypothetical protein
MLEAERGQYSEPRHTRELTFRWQSTVSEVHISLSTPRMGALICGERRRRRISSLVTHCRSTSFHKHLSHRRCRPGANRLSGGMELIAREVSNAVSTKCSNCEVHDLL